MAGRDIGNGWQHIFLRSQLQQAHWQHTCGSGRQLCGRELFSSGSDSISHEQHKQHVWTHTPKDACHLSYTSTSHFHHARGSMSWWVIFVHTGSFHTLGLQQCLQRFINNKPPEVGAIRCEIALLGHLRHPHACVDGIYDVTEVGTVINTSLTMPYNQAMLLHLRHCTVGELSLERSHNAYISGLPYMIKRLLYRIKLYTLCIEHLLEAAKCTALVWAVTTHEKIVARQQLESCWGTGRHGITGWGCCR